MNIEKELTQNSENQISQLISHLTDEERDLCNGLSWSSSELQEPLDMPHMQYIQEFIDSVIESMDSDSPYIMVYRDCESLKGLSKVEKVIFFLGLIQALRRRNRPKEWFFKTTLIIDDEGRPALINNTAGEARIKYI